MKRLIEAVVTVNGIKEKKSLEGDGMVFMSFKEEVRGGHDVVGIDAGIVGKVNRRALADGMIDIMNKFEAGDEVLLTALLERMFTGKSFFECPEHFEGKEPSNVDEFLEQLLKKRRQG